MSGARFAVALLALCLATAGAAQARLRIFSYDPADAETRHAAGNLTFEFDQGLTSTTVRRILATDAEASAELTRASAGALGDLAGAASGRDLYAVAAADQGSALIDAFCPGATRAWMAFGKVKYNRDLRILVLGDGGAGGKPRLCRTLGFTFHGEWRVPSNGHIDPHDLERRRLPT
ncbi:MAG: hypothetical protein ABI376_07140 [Caulobacteraceae bacterium]